jgi:hypothetical protein
MTSKSLNTYIWLEGNPIFSLSYSDRKSVIKTDLTGYRPDPLQYLSPNKKYKSHITFDREIDHENNDVWILKKIKIDGATTKDLTFVYIR